MNVNSQPVHIKERSILTIFPHYPVELKETSTDFEGIYDFFSMDYMLEFFRSNNEIPVNIELNPFIEVSENEFCHILEYHYFVSKQIKVEFPYKERIINKLLQTLAIIVGGIYIKQSYHNTNTSSHYHKEIISRFFQLLSQHSNSKKNIAFYADKLCLSSKYVSALVIRYTGRSILTWINIYITIHAKYLLRSNQMTIAQISDELGFPNPSFFGRFMKKHTGITPGDYRRF